MILRHLTILFLFATTAAQAQNCSNIKSGLDANQKPQNTGRDLVGKSLDDIIEQGWMTFAVYDDFAPYAYEKEGKLCGVDIDIGKVIAKEISVETHFLCGFCGWECRCRSAVQRLKGSVDWWSLRQWDAAHTLQP